MRTESSAMSVDPATWQGACSLQSSGKMLPPALFRVQTLALRPSVEWPHSAERYFDGPTPEGSAYEKATPDLRAETSLNADGGIKYSNDWLTGEALLFQNDIHEAITQM